MRIFVRIALIAAVLIYLFDAGIEAENSRKKRNHHRRSKRTEAEREERRKRKGRSGEGEVQKIQHENESFIKLVETQQKFKHHKSKAKQPRVKQTSLSQYEDIPSRLYRQYLEDQKKQANAPVDDGVTVLPLVHAKLDFFVKRELSMAFYEPPTSTTIEGFSSTEFGLIPVHNANGKYGLHSSAERIFGHVVHISDAGRTNSHFACGNAIANIDEIPRNSEPWIAMVERGHCSFFTKIKLAERNNASAVIIYDNTAEEVPKMNTLGANIVSVAISRHDGHRVARLADTKTKVLVNIVVNTHPDSTTKPEVVTSSITPPDSAINPEVTASSRMKTFAMQRKRPGNGAKSTNAAFVTIVLTTISAFFLLSMTSS